MAATPFPLPKLRRQKEKNRPDRAFVVLDGRKIPGGRWGTEDAQRRYDRAIAEWLSNDRRLPIEADDLVSVMVLMDRYLTHAEGYYVHRDGSPTWEQANIRQALKPLSQLYTDLPVAAFGPRQLRVVRQSMIERGWSRPFINQNIDRLRRMFKWGIEHELVPAEVGEALRAVAGLKCGRTEAPEPDPVGPVPDEQVDATLPHLTPTLAAMVRLQRLTGMRPGEACTLTTGMIDVDGKVSPAYPWAFCRPPTRRRN